MHDTVIPYGTENKLFYFLFYIRMLLSCYITGWLECCSSVTWLHNYCRICSPVKWLEDWIFALLPNDWRISVLLCCQMTGGLDCCSLAKWLEDWIVALCQMTGGLDCCSLPSDWRISMLLCCQITRGLECCCRRVPWKELSLLTRPVPLDVFEPVNYRMGPLVETEGL